MVDGTLAEFLVDLPAGDDVSHDDQAVVTAQTQQAAVPRNRDRGGMAAGYRDCHAAGSRRIKQPNSPITAERGHDPLPATASAGHFATGGVLDPALQGQGGFTEVPQEAEAFAVNRDEMGPVGQHGDLPTRDRSSYG